MSEPPRPDAASRPPPPPPPASRAAPACQNSQDTNTRHKPSPPQRRARPGGNSANHEIRDADGIDAWPTLVPSYPEGNIVAYTAGEGNYALLDPVIGRLVD